MDYLIYIAFGLGAVVFSILGWLGVRWWIINHGPRSNLLKERIQILSEKNQVVITTDPIFKETLFSENPVIHDILDRFKLSHALNDLILKAGSEFSVHEFLMWKIGIIAVSFVGLWMLLGSAVSAFWGSLLFGVAPIVWLMSENRKRKIILEKQLPDLLEFMSRSLSAGHSFNSSLQNAAAQSPEPISSEFKICFDQLNVGMPIRDVMAGLVKRIDTSDIRFFAIAVVLNREVGGNLAELLSDVAALIRGRLTTRLMINTLTAEGRSTAKFLGVLPIVAVILLKLIDPHYFDPILKSDSGVRLFAFTAVWAIVGMIWMRKISNIRL
ncbi:type II secretion system F family protein [Polynucleobacter sp. MWH-Braz-FAM2G]|uniref:type II secretion system F family protein n=1 Tax=Polynucleobacter sp. MWH-Braz-FAM2G TaxID=1855883 RepID=UPI001BFDBBFC|nr:type II secretion system F family protein [Polynucleobacter sp. MWH-Braz-FAM2G]QWD89944.1 type II secretion system F family protein [Polynucleobacter sp. MWH-Braz-FAM2G]